MPRKEITPIELAEKYLLSIGLDKKAVKRALLPQLFDDTYAYIKMAMHNIVLQNKNGDPSSQTHIYINRGFWGLFFSDKKIQLFYNTGDSQDSKQNMEVFEGNIASLIDRRNKKQTRQNSLVQTNPKRTYNKASCSILMASTHKKFFYQSGNQVHIGIRDDEVFSDFRLGILLDDSLILLKYKNKQKVLAIAVPSEFCSRYSIKGAISGGTVRIKRQKNTVINAQRKAEELEDANYASEANADSVKSEITKIGKLPAPKGCVRNSSSKLKYKGKPARGKGAIKRANYKCECNKCHKTFISRTTNKSYMEPHHLIPISKQDLFDVDIDITCNLICLCPICHRKIHLGKKQEIRAMLKMFYDMRKDDLFKCGIDIDLYQLFAFYDV